MFAQGFAIKKELINGKSVNEEGIMGELNKQGARIIEISDGKAKYTELSPQDIRKLISIRSNPSDLMERLTPLLKHKKHRHHHAHRHHHTRRHHTRRHHTRRHHTKRHHTKRHHKHGVASGHTKRHKKKKTRKRKHKRTKRCKRK